MDRTNRWLGLAIVGLLALVAQPAAVGTGSLASTSADERPAGQQCSAPTDAALLNEVSPTQIADELPEADETVCRATSAVAGAVVTVEEPRIDEPLG